MGEVTWLTWQQMTCTNNPRYTKCGYPVTCNFLKVWLYSNKVPGGCYVANLRHFLTVQSFTYDVTGQWTDLTWKWVRCQKVRLGWGVGGSGRPSFSSIPKGSGAVAKKTVRGWHQPPSVGEGKITLKKQQGHHLDERHWQRARQRAVWHTPGKFWYLYKLSFWHILKILKVSTCELPCFSFSLG